MDFGDQATRWTIRIALSAIFAVLAGDCLVSGKANWAKQSRLIWSTGCLFFLAHIAFAFHYFHQWSHLHAYEETAKQTYEAVGLNWGGGIYFNHLMAIVWLVDVIYWWCRPEKHQANKFWHYFVIGFFLFMAFNGTIVFKDGALRWISLVVFLALGFCWIFMLAKNRSGLPNKT